MDKIKIYQGGEVLGDVVIDPNKGMLMSLHTIDIDGKMQRIIYLPQIGYGIIIEENVAIKLREAIYGQD